MWFHGCSGHRRTLLWGRATWRAGLLGVPAGGDPPTVLLAAPLAFQAPSRLTVGPGYLACRRAAARPLAVRAASFARRVVSKPGQALPPPTGTATRPLRHPHTSGARYADVRFSTSSRHPSRPYPTHRHRNQAPPTPPHQRRSAC